MKKRELERHLADHGCQLVRQAAKHEMWENPATGERATVPRHREIKTPTSRRNLPAAQRPAAADAVSGIEECR